MSSELDQLAYKSTYATGSGLSSPKKKINQHLLTGVAAAIALKTLFRNRVQLVGVVQACKMVR